MCFTDEEGGRIKVKLRYVRRIMEGNSKAFSIFATYLHNMKNWDEYVVELWEANDTLQRLKGRHTKEFSVIQLKLLLC